MGLRKGGAAGGERNLLLVGNNRRLGWLGTRSVDPRSPRGRTGFDRPNLWRLWLRPWGGSLSGTSAGHEPWSGERGGSSGRLREFVRVGGTRRSSDRSRAYCLAETAQLGHHSRKPDQDQTAGKGADTRDDERRA
jgi:hypothetical protein